MAVVAIYSNSGVGEQYEGVNRMSQDNRNSSQNSE